MFGASILSESAPFDIFRSFGFQSGRDAQKFEGFDAEEDINGILHLTKHCTGFVSGKVVEEYDLGTHTTFIADVVDAGVLSEENSMTYTYYHKFVKPAPPAKKAAVKGWRCTVCGYVYEGEELPADFICPLCKHGASDFVPIEAEASSDNKTNNIKKENTTMELKGTKTEQNLMTAFAGESQARNKYTYFASKAKKEGYEQIAALFLETADNEKEHAKLWFKYLGGSGSRRRKL